MDSAIRPAFSDYPDEPITLSRAIQIARRNYPRIRAARFKSLSARHAVEKEKTLYLPRADILFQASRGTSNNITGPMLPQATIPMITGAVAGGNDLTGGWGTGIGTLIQWEPFDFGLRGAKVRKAKEEERVAQAELALTKLEVVSACAEAFLRASATRQALIAAQAKLEEMRTFRESVQVLVSKHLRSNTDYFLAQAEEAKAKDQVIEAQQALEVALISLSESMGLSATRVTIDDRALVQLEPGTETIQASTVTHPELARQSAMVKLAEARKRVVDKSYYPKFTLVGALYGRGSSFLTDVTINQGEGYYPTKFNYAIGLNVFFPVLDIFELRASRKMEMQNTDAERSQMELASLKLRCQDERARAMMKGALMILKNAPVKVKAAEEAMKSVKVRYRVGLSGINEVASNEQLLAESKVQETTAKLRVWQALLAEAVAKGDISQFVRVVDEAYRN